MADCSLDDFFAKKDKSKKGKSKFTTSDTIAKKLEDSGKRSDLPLKKDVKDKLPTSSQSSVIIQSVTGEQEDEEWQSVEEKEADYSGLKIQALSISDKEREDEQLKDQNDPDGELNRQGDGQSGPWKVQQPEQETTPVETPEEQQPAAPTPAAVKAAYVPPALRNAERSAPRRSQRGAPELNEMHYPSLSNTVDAKYISSESEKNFQSVRHGGRSKDLAHQTAPLDLGNKYAVLHNN